MKFSIRQKIVIPIVLMFLAITVTFSVFFPVLIKKISIVELEDKINISGHILKAAIEDAVIQGEYNAMLSFMDKIKYLPQLTKILVLDNMTEVLFSYPGGSVINGTLLNKLSEEQFYQSGADLSRVLFLKDRGEIIGYLIFSVSLQQIDTHIEKSRNLIIFLNLLILCFFIAIVLYISRKIVEPIIALRDAHEEVRNGNLHVSAKTDFDDEIGDLCVAFNEMVNRLKDVKKDLLDKNMGLRLSNLEVEKRYGAIEEKMWESTFEVSTIHELSNSISYSQDYNQLFKTILDALYKAFNYELCGLMVFDDKTVQLTMLPAPDLPSVTFINVEDSLLKVTSILCGEDISGRKFKKEILGLDSRTKNQYSMISYLNVPLIINSQVVGFLHISSQSSVAFTEFEIRLMYSIAGLASGAIERLRAAIIAEKVKMEALVQSMHEGVIMVDEHGEVAILNPKARQLLGFHEVGQVSTQDLNGKFQALDIYRSIYECSKNRDSQSITKEVPLKLEKSFILHCTIRSVMRDEDFVGVSIILRDVTKEKEIEHLKSEFTSVISHELRTPLSSIKNAVNLILSKATGEINENQKKFLTLANRNSDRLKGIIDDLLDLSKLEAGKMAIEFTEVDVSDPVNTVIDSLMEQATAKAIRLKSIIPSYVPLIYGDQDRLIQVLFNLTGNAIKFTPENGEVCISLKVIEGCLENIPEKLTNLDYNRFMQVTVSDTGIGIPEEETKAIFDKFHQVASSLVRKVGGTGLGLPIVKSLVEAHYGTVRVVSSQGKGSQFIFTIPVLVSKIESVAGMETSIS